MTTIANTTSAPLTASVEGKVRAVIEKVRPYIQSHGGDVWLVSVGENVVTLKIEGTCVECPLANFTYNKVVKTLLTEEAPEIERVILT